MSEYPYRYRALANGLRTDHPIPGLPFVDDSHIPLDDPTAIEAVGRHEGAGTWGREDPIRDAGWAAFTTDQERRDLAWCVRWHPDHGRSVVIYSDDEAASLHMTWLGSALLFRAGGYWWDGTTWCRPAQILDGASEEYVRRPVPAAATITAADLLNDQTDQDHARVLQIVDIDPDAPTPNRWIDHLALWAAHRDGTMPLDASVVNLTAPELTGDQLIGVADLAEVVGLAPSTLRAYIARGEGDVPQPQATIGKRSVWARPVAEEWAQQRDRSDDALEEAVSVRRPDKSVAAGIADIWDWFTRDFTNRMSSPQWRKRWALRWRTDTAIRELAQTLAGDVAGSLDRIISVADLAATVRNAVLFEFSQQQEPQRLDATEYWISRQVAHMLDWLIRHDPPTASHAITTTVREAQRHLGIATETSEASLRRGLGRDSKLDSDKLNDFFARVESPR
jgi:predicted DNA-binding transcriptional regulator AlpA